MAKLILQGDVADVELTVDDEDGGIIATCVRHDLDQPGGCSWTERYDDLRDASEYAEAHADTGRG
jgi:hypothetical protein